MGMENQRQSDAFYNNGNNMNAMSPRGRSVSATSNAFGTQQHDAYGNGGGGGGGYN